MTRRLIVFAKLPVAGRVKTRLAATVGEAAALDAHRRLLATTLALGEACGVDRLEFRFDACGLAVAAAGHAPAAGTAPAAGPGPTAGGGPTAGTGPTAGFGPTAGSGPAPGAAPTLAALLAPEADPAALPAGLAARGWRTAPQRGTDLGARMRDALEAAIADGDRPVLVGGDCPVLEAADLAAAFEALERADAVFAPSEDGGYALVGLSRPLAAPFEAMAWSTPGVMAETLARLEAGGARVEMLRTVWDVDDDAGLARWTAALAAARPER